jgi:hypothetical protein
MTYLDKLAEEIRRYKVVTYVDHTAEDFIRYFDDYEHAFQYWKSQLNTRHPGNHTASVVIIDVKTGQPVIRQTWRI